MATTIRLKRRIRSGSNGILLQSGEPFYNTADKRLYIGNSNNEAVDNKKHLTQITNLDTSSSPKIKFQIGEDTSNIFEKVISAESISGKIDYASLSDKAYNADSATNATNVSTTINGVQISDIFESNGSTVKQATMANSATTSTVSDTTLNIPMIQDQSKDTLIKFTIGEQTFTHEVTIPVEGVHGSVTYANTAGTADTATTAQTANNAISANKLSVKYPIDGILFDGTQELTHYGVSTTASNSAVKDVTIENFDSNLRIGSQLFISFTNKPLNSQEVLLRVNNGTQKNCYTPNINGTLVKVTGEYLNGGGIYHFIYSTKGWILINPERSSEIKRLTSWGTF